MRTRMWLAVAMIALLPECCGAGETKIVLRDYLNQPWTNELLGYPFSAPNGACDASSVTLAGPQGPVPVQLSEIEFWPGTRSVQSARLSFIASLAPLASDTYTVCYRDKPAVSRPGETDLKVTPRKDRVEITTAQFGARLLLGEQTFPEAVDADSAPGPVLGMRLADGTWFGGSRLYGPGKIAAYSGMLTDAGPVFARVAIRYTYAGGNTLDLSVQVAAGDNAMRMETRVAKHQPENGFNLELSRGLPPLVLQVQDELRKDRECFTIGSSERKALAPLQWAEIPLKDYVTPDGVAAGLVTKLTPWEDWFGTFTQTRIRLKLENTARELQIRSLDAGSWVEPRPIEAIFGPNENADPAKGLWVSWNEKCMPILCDSTGEVFLQVSAAQGLRKWTVSDCLSMPGVAALFHHYGYQPESEFPPATRPAVGYRLNEVKDYVLEWPGDAGRHPRLFLSRSDLETVWKREVTDPAVLEELAKIRSAPPAKRVRYHPDSSYTSTLGAYLLSGGDPEIAEKTQLLARLRQSLQYDLWGCQFGSAGTATAILYDALIDSPVVPDAQRPVLRAQMAYFGYRLADPAVWSAERGYASGNQNMTQTWELSRGLVACTIPEHPMAKTWYRGAERIMEMFLDHMVGPSGEFLEPVGRHGRVDILVAFAIASTNAGLHDYVNDPRLRRVMTFSAKMLTPRDPRPRGHHAFARPHCRYLPAQGRDPMGGPGAAYGALARATRKSDPHYSQQMQWAWLEQGASEDFSLLGGFARVFPDHDLPSKLPAWISEVFPRGGAVLRHGLGTPDEHQVTLYSGDHRTAFYPSHTGCFPSIFAYGTPVAGSFPGGYWFQEGFLTCHVDLAHDLGTMDQRQACSGYLGVPAGQEGGKWDWPDRQPARFGEHGGLGNVSAFAALPRQDYAAIDVALHYPRGQKLPWVTDLPEWPPVSAKGQPPVDWRRQVLFLKDDAPAGPAYLLIRDTVKGGQPTMWQMWTVSEKIGTAEEVKDLAAFLKDKPGPQICPARELKGDRFTAIGQLGVDVEYYIAAPTGTPRHTLRWGTDMIDWANKLAQPEYQDLLHLQMPGDGQYFVAFFPRKRGGPVPSFSKLGGGTIIKVSGDFGSDYGFLSALEATATGEGATFRGTAGSVQHRTSGRVLALGAKGEVRYETYGLSADFAASLRIGESELTVELPEKVIDGDKTLQPMVPRPAGKVTLVAPGDWSLAKPLSGVKLTKSATGFLLEIPAGIEAVVLVKEN